MAPFSNSVTPLSQVLGELTRALYYGQTSVMWVVVGICLAVVGGVAMWGSVAGGKKAAARRLEGMELVATAESAPNSAHSA